jgi:hypothetical protein
LLGEDFGFWEFLDAKKIDTWKKSTYVGATKTTSLEVRNARPILLSITLKAFTLNDSNQRTLNSLAWLFSYRVDYIKILRGRVASAVRGCGGGKKGWGAGEELSKSDLWAGHIRSWYYYFFLFRKQSTRDPWFAKRMLQLKASLEPESKSPGWPDWGNFTYLAIVFSGKSFEKYRRSQNL